MAVKKSVFIEDIDLGYKKIMYEIHKMDKSYTAVGWFGSGGDPSTDVAARAAVLNFGAVIRVTKKMKGFLSGVLGLHLKKTTQFIRIPERPFIQHTAELSKAKLGELLEIEYNNLLSKKFTIEQILSRLGEWYVGRLKSVIRRAKWAELHPLTIAKKGSSIPLINTGQMRNSITHREIIK